MGMSTGRKVGLAVAGTVVGVGLLWALLRRSDSSKLDGAQGLGRGRKFEPRGAGRRLGRVDDYGPTQTATLYVGQNRGEDPPNQRGACARKPKRFGVEALDKAFLSLRARQVGKPNTGATRTQGKGWFRGEPEDAAAYQVIHIPNDAETNYRQFRANINKLAENLGKKLCQDSVIVVHSDGDTQRSCGAVWYEPGRGDC